MNKGQSPLTAEELVHIARTSTNPDRADLADLLMELLEEMAPEEQNKIAMIGWAKLFTTQRGYFRQ